MNSIHVKMICFGIAMLTSTTFYKVFNQEPQVCDRMSCSDSTTFFQGWGLAIVVSTLVGVLIYRFVDVKKVELPF